MHSVHSTAVDGELFPIATTGVGAGVGLVCKRLEMGFDDPLTPVADVS